MVDHPGINKISVTGGVDTGKKIASAAGANLKHVTLELGGKSPLIVFDDAKISNAVKATLLANFYTQGEICSNGTRVFVHRKIYGQFLEQLVAATRKLVIGDPNGPENRSRFVDKSRTRNQGFEIYRDWCQRRSGTRAWWKAGWRSRQLCRANNFFKLFRPDDNCL